MVDEGMALLELKNISKAYYGNPILEDVSVSVASGSIFGILGVNGSGKTTLVRLLSGDLSPDAGELIVDGQKITLSSPCDAMKQGISTIHQGSELIGHLTVAENVFIFGYNHSPKLFKRHSIKKISALAEELLHSLNIEVSALARADEIDNATAQLIKIAAVMGQNPSVIIVDEPFAMLSSSQCDAVCELFRTIKQRGVSILFTTGNILKTIDVSDDIAILKEGHLIRQKEPLRRDAEYYVKEISDTAKYRYPRISNRGTRRVLSLKNITADMQLRNISFDMYSGEILGVAGAPGAGKSTLARILFGAQRIKDGQMFVEGRLSRFKEPADAVNCGIGMISGNSEKGGVISDFSISQNISLAGLENISNYGVIDGKLEGETALRYIKKYGIVPADILVKAYAMSEGQRQKVVFCKWMLKGCKILIMDNATRGMDISAKVELYNFMNAYALNGGSILFISTDYNELLGMCDRMLVLNGGRLTGILGRQEFSMLKIVDMLSK